MIRVADFIMDCIAAKCAQHIFTVTGRGILYLTDAVAKHPDLTAVSVHHEQAGAFAAVAYGVYNNRPGVCLVSTGCAATNTLTGLLCAWQDGIPCLFISGQNMRNESTRYNHMPIRTYGSQEMDIIPVVEPLTKYAVMIKEPEQIVYELEKAIFIANHGRKGPVWIDVPLDVQNMRIDPDNCQKFRPEQDSLVQSKSIQKSNDGLDKSLKELIARISVAERPVVLIGSGIRSAGVLGEFKLFIDKTKIPVTYAHSAVDIYTRDNDMSIGAVGSLCGTRAGNFAVQNSDLILVLGCRMSSMTTGEQYEKFAREAQVIVVDIDEQEHQKNTIQIDQFIHINLCDFFRFFLECDLPVTNKWWQEKCKHYREIFSLCEERYKSGELVDMYHLAETFSHTLSDNAVFLCDAGLEELIFPSNVEFREGMRCIHPVMQGSMGFALPAAIGAYYASKQLIVAVIGDGSIMMNLQELQTISFLKIPIKIFVISNNMYAVITRRQRDLFRTRTIGTNEDNGVAPPDFSKIAECFGIGYYHIKGNCNLINDVKSVLELPGPVLCEIDGIENQEYLRDGHAKNKDNKYVHRPIEDQIPFLDRKLFLSEMVIEPIDQ